MNPRGLKRWLMGWCERQFCALAAEEIARAVEQSEWPPGQDWTDRWCPPWLPHGQVLIARSGR